MVAKIIKLTESEVIEHIRNVVNEAKNESEGKTSANASNAIERAKELNRQEDFTSLDNSTGHDDVITKCNDTEQKANDELLTSFASITFLFYATTRLGRTAFVTFRVNDIKKLMGTVAILSGEVMFDGDVLKGDISIDFINNRVFYKEKRTRYTYTLESDNRTKKQWESLLEQLNVLLENKI